MFAEKPQSVKMPTRPGARTFADRSNNRFARPSTQDISNAGYVHTIIPAWLIREHHEDITKWCNMQFGNKNWVLRAVDVRRHAIFFTRDQDKLAFVMRWINEGS